jgi:hypothetical protein
METVTPTSKKFYFRHPTVFSTIYKPSPSSRSRVSSTAVCHPDNKGGIRVLPAGRPVIDLPVAKSHKAG